MKVSIRLIAAAEIAPSSDLLGVKIDPCCMHLHTNTTPHTQSTSPDFSLGTPADREGFSGYTNSHTAAVVGLFPLPAPPPVAPGMNIYRAHCLRHIRVWSLNTYCSL